MFEIALDVFVVHFAAHEAFGVEDCVSRVGVERVFSAVTDTNTELVDWTGLASSELTVVRRH